MKKILVLAWAAAMTPAIFADAPKSTPAKPAPARSVFVIPSNVHEGRDPFFPESTRPYEDAKPTQNTLGANAFTVKGLSVQRGHAMVIINNHTFAVGDEGDVMTSTGRAHIHLVEIRNGVAVIEFGGGRRELPIAK